MMVDFIAEHRESYGVEPICEVLPIAPSTYYEHARQRRDPERRSARARRDESLRMEINRIHDASHDGCYGADKIWQEMMRTKKFVARCTVERLMRVDGLRGVVRGPAFTVTTHPDVAASRPADLVHREFTATKPNQLWVADITYVATWCCSRARPPRWGALCDVLRDKFAHRPGRACASLASRSS
jgi:putative transposase